MRPIVFHSFFLSDVEDPEIYAAQPIWQWEQTEFGQWCKEHSVEQVSYRIVVDHDQFGYRVDLYSTLTEQDYIFFKLKWGCK